jgi:hypothetical protein
MRLLTMVVTRKHYESGVHVSRCGAYLKNHLAYGPDSHVDGTDVLRQLYVVRVHRHAAKAELVWRMACVEHGPRAPRRPFC